MSVLEKVRIEGAILGKIEDALSGFEMGLTADVITKLTKLPYEFVELLSEAAGDVTAESAYVKYAEMYSVEE